MLIHLSVYVSSVLSPVSAGSLTILRVFYATGIVVSLVDGVGVLVVSACLRRNAI